MLDDTARNSPRVLYELPEEEWSRPWTERTGCPSRAAAVGDAGAELAERALIAAVVGTALLFPALHLYSLWTIGRCLALPGAVARPSLTKALAALVLDAAALIAATSLTLHLLRS